MKSKTASAAMAKAGYDIMVEGKANVAVPKYSGKAVSSAMPVFYNPVMKPNRDITVLLMAAAVNVYGIRKWNIADVMAATGVRGIRILLENGSSSVESLKMNDYSAAAVALIKKNLKLNRINIGEKVSVSGNEANKFLLNNRNFNYIDIDPFGYPGVFLDSAVKKIMHNGILAVTATDTSALAGTAAAACRRKYMAVPLKNAFMHETGIRILIRLVQLIGAVHEKALIPVFSYYKDHYIRAFFLCKAGAHRVDELLDMHKEILYCGKCCEKKVRENENVKCRGCGGNSNREKPDLAQSQKGASRQQPQFRQWRNAQSDFVRFATAQSCRSRTCDLSMQKAGPVWAGKLFDSTLARRITAAAATNKFSDKQTRTFLEIIAEEAEHETKTGAGFYAIGELCEKNRVARQPKTSDVIKRLRQQGYAASVTHCSTTGVKTNAPFKHAVNAVTGR